jgi:hypothetical protein
VVTLSIGLAGLVLYSFKSGEFLSSSFDLFSYDTPVLPFLLSIIISLVIESFHELAHLITAYNYTGKLGDVGYVIHFGFPFVYVDIPEIRSFNKQKTARVLLAGPLTTLFFASISTFLYFIAPFWKYLWAWNAFSLYLTALVVFSPIIKTNGYYLFQSILNFPNLFSHTTKYVVMSLKKNLGITSKVEYEDYLSAYSNSERRTPRVYPWIWLIGVILLVPVFVTLVLQMHFLQVIQVTADLVAGQAGNKSPKVYTLWLTYTISLLILFLGSLAIIAKSLKKLVRAQHPRKEASYPCNRPSI